MPKVKSPCIGVCVLDPTWNAYCIGCKRFLREVEYWDSYTEAEKQQIVDRINSLMEEDPADYPKY